MERVRAISMPIVEALASSTAPDLGWTGDVNGAAYDVGEYLSGTPECWIRPDPAVSKPCVTIAVNTVSSGGIPAAMLELRGAAVVALTLALQSNGYAVRVYAIEGMRPGYKDPDVWHRVCLTDEGGGPLDTDRLLYALAHPSAPRQLGYALGCTVAGVNPTGAAIGWPKEHGGNWGGGGSMMEWLPEEWRGADVFLPPPFWSDASWNDEASVSAWVQETYARLAGDT
jgi:hypothetical protein